MIKKLELGKKNDDKVPLKKHSLEIEIESMNVRSKKL